MFHQFIRVELVLGKKSIVLKRAKTHNYCRQFVEIGRNLFQMVFSFLLPMLLMIPLISCQGSRQYIDQDTEKSRRPETFSIPRWYAELPIVYGCRFAYGYGGIYLDKTRQKEAIVKNGAANMAKNERVLIKAGWAGSQTHGQGLNASYIIEKGWSIGPRFWRKI